MTLGALAFGFAMGVGLPLGFFTAARRGRWEDYAGSFLAAARRLRSGLCRRAGFDSGFFHQVKSGCPSRFGNRRGT